MAHSEKISFSSLAFFANTEAVFDDALFELIRMLMSKNVNNDVYKDLPIFTYIQR